MAPKEGNFDGRTGLYFLLFVVCMCLKGVSCDNIGTGPFLMVADYYSIFSSRLIYIDGTGAEIYNHLVENPSISYKVLHQETYSYSEKSAVVFDYQDKLTFWSDPGHKAIYSLSLDGDDNKARIVYTGTSSTVDGMTVDWLTNNIYWADAAYNWIKVSNYDGSSFRTLITTELDHPTGIACNPLTGYLYWSDAGSTFRIERSTLSGNNRTILVDENVVGRDVIGKPVALTMDYANNRLYWADSLYSRIVSLDLDDPDAEPATVIQSPERLKGMYDIDFDQNTNYQQMGNLAKKVTSSLLLTLERAVSKPFSVYYKIEDDRIISDHELILSYEGGKLCQMPANVGHEHIPDVYNISCFSGVSAKYMDFDVYGHYIFARYSAGTNQNQIWRAKLKYNETWVKTVELPSADIRGLAVDWLASNLYWIDKSQNSIGISNLNGEHVSTLLKLQENVDDPSAIVVHAEHRYVFWADIGTNARIERSDLRCRHRKIIVDSDIRTPTHIAIDFNKDRLYWTDDSTSVIESVSFDGYDRQKFMDLSMIKFAGLSIFQDILYVAYKNILEIYDINSKTKIRSLVSTTNIVSIKFFHESLQPIAPGTCIKLFCMK
ncbi:low-density lipoprotein receptor-related protein 2-like [Glandiceps talaboti]